MSAEELFEWWTLFNDEPWGEMRADLRAWAHACLSLGAKGIQLTWPYTPPEWTDDDIKAEMDRIEREACVNRNHQDRD